MHNYPSNYTQNLHLYEVGTVTVSAIYRFFFFFGRNTPQWARVYSLLTFLDHTQGRTIVGRTPLDERSLPDNTQHSQQTDIHALGGIRTHNPSKRSATDQRLRSRATGTGTIYRLPWLTRSFWILLAKYWHTIMNRVTKLIHCNGSLV